MKESKTNEEIINEIKLLEDELKKLANSFVRCQVALDFYKSKMKTVSKRFIKLKKRVKK